MVRKLNAHTSEARRIAYHLSRMKGWEFVEGFGY